MSSLNPSVSYHHNDLINSLNRQQRQAHAALLSDWIQSRMDADKDARYIPFVINSIKTPPVPTWAVGRLDPRWFRRRALTKACEAVTMFLNPSFSRSNPTRRRNDPNLSVGVILLPATKAGDTHLHGGIRIPKSNRQKTALTIRDHGHVLTIFGPSAIAAFSNEVFDRLGTRNIWFAHDNGQVIDETQQEYRGIHYLKSDWKEEVREWDQVEFVPAYLFSRLPAPSQTEPLNTQGAIQ